MAHSLWCGKSCSECNEKCTLDESMACSPDCDAIDPITNERDTSKCAGCDARPEDMKSSEEVNIKRVMENIAAIGMMAGVLIAEGQFYPSDSTTLHGGIVKMGFEFEKTYSDEDIDHDYIGMIDEFARKKILEFYGIEE